MEVIKINSSKIKIMLSAQDMDLYHISSCDLDYANRITRQAIRHILQDICTETGFDANGGIFVQVFASCEGGCELFISKTEDDGAQYDNYDCHECSDFEFTLSEHKPALPAKIPQKTVAYAFDTLEDMIDVCRRLERSTFCGKSSAFCGEDGMYYLTLKNIGQCAYTRLDCYTFILEYGSRVKPEVLIPYINEHGNAICTNDAVETLGKF